MARINVIQYDAAEGELKTVYDDLITKRGQLSEVLKIQSLHPSSIKSHTAFYMDIMFNKSALSRAEKEMIAVVVSVVNGCMYCQTHHGTALNNYWKDESRIEQPKEQLQPCWVIGKRSCHVSVCSTSYPIPCCT